MNRKDQCEHEGDFTVQLPSLEQEEKKDRAPGMEAEICEMVDHRIEPKEQMFDLITEKRQGDIELRIIGRENRSEGIERKVKDEGVFVDEHVVIPDDKSVAEGIPVDRHCCESDQTAP